MDQNALDRFMAAFRLEKLSRPWGVIFTPDHPIPIDVALPLTPLLDLYWDQSDAPWTMALAILTIGGSGVVVGLRDGDDRFYGIAAGIMRERVAASSEFLESLLSRNGAEYHVALFASLPSRTVNHRPDLLPAASVKGAYSSWLTWAEALGAQPSEHLAQALAAHRRRGPADPLPTRESPRELFDRYFDGTYVEQPACT